MRKEKADEERQIATRLREGRFRGAARARSANVVEETGLLQTVGAVPEQPAFVPDEELDVSPAADRLLVLRPPRNLVAVKERSRESTYSKADANSGKVAENLLKSCVTCFK